MSEIERRLAKCFLAAFPDLREDQVPGASHQTIPAWDSVAHVSLMAVIEEEFGLGLDYEDFEDFNSYAAILAVLNQRKNNC